VAGIEVVDEHPLKLPLADVPRDESLTEETGWANMAVQWIVTDKTVGAESHVVGITVFGPGAKHHPHRHPNAEEAQYLIQGSGLARVGDKDIVQNAGDTVFVPRNEWHGFENTSDGETIMIWTYGGAANLEQAGYVRRQAEAQESGDTHPGAAEVQA
jgi:quercetin dioxygenase-like cupin family protein